MHETTSSVDAQAAAWKKASRSVAEWESTLSAYAFPVLGDMPVDAIASVDVMRVLTPIWGRSARPRFDNITEIMSVYHQANAG